MPSERPRGGGKPQHPRSQRPGRPAPRPRQERPENDSRERLQKILAHAGLGSRRACEELILQGRVTVDGQFVRELGTRVDPVRQKIAVDGQSIRSERPVYYAVNKPKGYVSTNSDPAGRPRVIDLLPEIPERVFTVGRLDENSVGLMILTNDGELANRLAHPRYGVEKVYRAVVAGMPTPDVLEKLVEGVWLAEGKVRARRVKVVGKQGDAAVLEMILAEGKNREVRRMLARLGHKVMSLTRVRVGPVSLQGLSVGHWRRLAPEEVRRLQDIAAGLPDPGDPRGEARRPSGPPQRRPVGDGARRSGPGRPGPGGPRPARPSGPPSARRPASSPPQGPAPRPAPRGDGEPARRKILGMPTPPAPGRPARPRRKPPVRPGQRAPILKRPRRAPGGPPPGEVAE